MKRDNTKDAFLALVSAGLWEDIKVNGEGLKVNDLSLIFSASTDWQEINRLAEEQAVVGLVTAGLEHVRDVKVPQEVLLQFVGQALLIEQKNQAMNCFIGTLVEDMQQAGINVLLVKGQGVAQCYKRPLWRSSGDVDFFLDAVNYEKAKHFIIPLASSPGHENRDNKHFEVTIDPWVVELHGTLRCGVSARIDREIDKTQRDTFDNGRIRYWKNGDVDIPLPEANNDVIFVFTHFLKHFFKGGIGLRQICDWCRLLWTFRDSIDKRLLEERLNAMGLGNEWKAFAAFAVDYLGAPSDFMPLYSNDARWKKKARRIKDFILEVGNFGHNRDLSYYSKYSFIVRKSISFGRRCSDFARHVKIFPLDSLRFFPPVVYHGIRYAIRGE